jgi:cerevisin
MIQFVDFTAFWMTHYPRLQATNQISGTSMATPHVAGLVALIISTFGNKIPAEMTKLLQNYSLKGYVKNVRK